MISKLFTSATMALAIFSASASPLGTDLEYAPLASNSTLEKRATFQWRFYDNGGCNHNSNPTDTWPTNGSPPGQGDPSNCYSAPTGVNWNRVEIDVFFPSGGSLGVQTFCNINCGGGASVKQQNTNCYLPISGCAIGSFRVIS
ncbi:hypothetical protein GGR58DRAFT_23290 [Xylaria digitata]|nr:hypothetical protein GGR58DRAFT_23290 [Xylaria digitata]